MKKYFILFLMMSSFAVAGDPVCSEQNSAEQATETKEITTDVPNYLKGATITVKLADGRETVVPAEKFKVVPRKQQFIVTKTEKSKVVSCTTNDPRKNRVSVLGGHGAQRGLNTDSSVPGAVSVESKAGAVFGGQYQRMLNDRWSLGVQGQSNKTGSVLIGIDF